MRECVVDLSLTNMAVMCDRLSGMTITPLVSSRQSSSRRKNCMPTRCAYMNTHRMKGESITQFS